MLPELHAALRALIYRDGRVDPADVDVTFRAPTREWLDNLTVPTINLFMLDLEENLELRRTSYETQPRGRYAEIRLPPRRIDLRYAVSAFAGDPDDELRLLWRVLAALMRHREFPMDLLPAELRGIRPALPARVLQADEGPKLLDIWGSLGVDPRPGFCYVLTAPLDLEIALSAPLVLSRSVRLGRLPEHGQPVDLERAFVDVGGLVLDPAGAPLDGVRVTVEGSAQPGSVSDAEGRFRLRGLRPGRATLHAAYNGSAKTLAVDVPASSYDITLDAAPAEGAAEQASETR